MPQRLRGLMLLLSLLIILAPGLAGSADQESNVQANKKEALAMADAGQKAKESGQFKQAIQHYNKAIELYWHFPPKDLSRIYMERAISLNGTGQYRRALEDCQMAIKWDPKNARAYYERGATLAILKDDPKAALPDVQKAYDLDPSNQEIKNGLEALVAELNKKPE